ncbi:MAG: hypothetical protein ABI689_00845 [Thermoanaerobaculia bacterium]
MTAAQAAICTVPGSHASLWAAVRDTACSEIDLAAQSRAESVVIGRSLTLAGPAGGGAILAGLLDVRGVGVVVTVSHLRVENGCQPVAAAATGGARLDGATLEVIASPGGPCPAVGLFADGFESGDSVRWSVTLP